MLAQDFDGRVQVVNNHGFPLPSAVPSWMQDIWPPGNGGQKKSKIFWKRDEIQFQHLYNGRYASLSEARRTHHAGCSGTGNHFKIKPVLQIQGEKLGCLRKGENHRPGKQIAMNAIKKMTSPNASERSQSRQTCGFDIAHTNNNAAAMDFREEVLGQFPDAKLCGSSVTECGLPHRPRRPWSVTYTTRNGE